MDGNGVMGAWPGKVTGHAHYAKTNNLNSNNSLPCSFSFLFNTALFCAKSLSYIQKKNYFTFILLFLKKSLDFFQPIIYHELIEDMFIFDYNPLLIYLYSPQKEQISLSALFIIYL